MATYTYSAEAKLALRKAITSHPQWPDYARVTGISSANLSIDAMESIAGIFENPRIDLTQYGTLGRKRRGWSSAPNTPPKPRTINPDMVASVKAEIDRFAMYINPKRLVFANDVFESITSKGGWATEGQYEALKGVANEGRAAMMGITPPTEPAAPTISGSNSSIPQISEPRANPMPTSPDPLNPSTDAARVLAQLLEMLGKAAPIDETRIIELIKAHAGKPATMRIDLTSPAQLPAMSDQLAHHKLPLLVSAMAAGVNVMLVGEAGSGKTKATEQAAEMLGLEYAMSGAVDSPYKLTGFVDAQGRIVKTPLRHAVEKGQAFCLDEIDGCLPGSLLPINSLSSNRTCDFPDQTIKAHPKFTLVACANTFGRGSDRLYVGRFQQDSAVLDRYAVIQWDIDPTVEAGMLGLPAPANAPRPVRIEPITDQRALESVAFDWLRKVQATRAAVQKHKLRHIISPRASQMGVKLLAAGWPWAHVEEACLFKGIDPDSRAKITQA